MGSYHEMCKNITSCGSFFHGAFVKFMDVMMVMTRECCDKGEKESQYIYKKSEGRHVG